MKRWIQTFNNQIWIPSIFTLPDGMLYPKDENGKLEWNFSPMVEIPEEERKNYPMPEGGGFYSSRYDTESVVKFDNFFEAMLFLNKKAGNDKNEAKKSELKLPNLKDA